MSEHVTETRTLSQHEKTVRLAASGIMIALATVLSMITVFRMPQGGSITLVSMLPICMISVTYGVRWGLGTAFAYGLIQLMMDFSLALSWGLSRKAIIACFLLDYMLAYTMLGFSGIFRNKGQGGILAGTVLAIVLRSICHIISGATVFSIWMPENYTSPWIYSFVYDVTFMGPELILTLIGMFVVCRIPALQKYAV